MKTKRLVLWTAAGVMALGLPVLAAEPEFNAAGDKYESGHFTVEAIAVDANSEEFNENADFTVYSIDDYTEAVPMADSYDANGATSENNTASMYVIMDDEKALLIDLGNGAAATAAHFGEDAEDQAVLDALDAEYKELVYSLVGDRELSIAVTHNHGDHLGYLSAMAGDNVKLYFPEEDYTDSVVENYGDLSETYDLETYAPGELTISLGEGLEMSTLGCAGHTQGSTIYVLETPLVTYEYDEAGEASDSSAQYLVFSGDALGSGSSAWIFSGDSMTTFSESIGPVYDKLASYTNYNDYLGGEEKSDAGILIEGGHGWQTTNRFGDMSMGLAYVENMKKLTEEIKDGDWVEEGYEDKSLEELLQEGYVVTKPLEHVFLDTTIYYGTELSDVAGMTTSMEAIQQYAGVAAEDTDGEAEAAQEAAEEEAAAEAEEEAAEQMTEAAQEAAAEDVQGAAVDIVDVEGGQVQGVAADVEGVQIFKGIPYAADTSGENRWKAPQPVEGWEGVKVCDTWGDQAMQQPASELNPVGGFWGDEFYFDESYDPAISENGLNLNVYTPAQTTEDNLPVLVYIHGGGNNHGHASEMEFNAAKLASKGIIVVTVQYRVSMYGFLTLPGLSAENESGASGNYAVLDLVKSLQWVQDNIAGFGGNPGQVTISGQSAGAMNVTALLRSPLADGLFQNAIIQSGFGGLLTAEGTSAYSDMETVQAQAEETIIAAMGLPEETTSEELVAELRSHDAAYYMETPSAVDENQTLYTAITNASSTYVIDGYVFTEESVDLNQPGALDGINIMIGGTSDEMTSLMGDPEGTMSLDDFAAAMTASYGEGYEEAYAPADEKEAYRLQLRSSSDLCLAKYVISAEYTEKNSDTNVYVYYFNQDLPGHENPVRDEEFYGAFHSSELWYFFDSMRDMAGQRQWTEADYGLADQITSYISNFVKTGDPNGEGLAEWSVCSGETEGAFMWWTEGQSQCVTNADEGRETLNRAAALASLGLTEEDLQ